MTNEHPERASATRRNDHRSPSLCITHDNRNDATVPCAVCRKPYQPPLGFAVVTDPQMEPVCEECGKKYAPKLHQAMKAANSGRNEEAMIAIAAAMNEKDKTGHRIIPVTSKGLPYWDGDPDGVAAIFVMTPGDAEAEQHKYYQ